MVGATATCATHRRQVVEREKKTSCTIWSPSGAWCQVGSGAFAQGNQANGCTAVGARATRPRSRRQAAQRRRCERKKKPPSSERNRAVALTRLQRRGTTVVNGKPLKTDTVMIRTDISDATANLCNCRSGPQKKARNCSRSPSKTQERIIALRIQYHSSSSSSSSAYEVGGT